ncbi:MAG: thiosulfate oxidation carrier complex protein SoxZ [Gammaproteobacteria bacterium]|nr:thiosulfate oxidation carrier complex protein SoxZ [Gammaproteobacteria bacterium]
MPTKPMKIRAWIDDATPTMASVKVIIFHEMESGLRKDKASGQVVPAQYITELACEHNGKTVLTCLWGPAISKNPFLAFRVKNVKKGDLIKLSWVDNKGDKETGESKVE